MDKAASKINDAYLKTNKVEGGIKDYNGGPCDLAGNNLTNYYWDQVNDGILDGSDQLWSGAGYCYRVVSFTNDTNELGNTQISDASKNNCPSC